MTMKDDNSFRDWVCTLTPADIYDFDSEGRGYKKDTMQMMRMAWDAAAKAQRERIAAHFDSLDKGAGGFYDPHEPAEIIRSL